MSNPVLLSLPNRLCNTSFLSYSSQHFFHGVFYLKNRQWLEINRNHLGIICLSIIAVILFAGLWPRDFQSGNDVALIPDGNGIRFSNRGILYTKPLPANRRAQSVQGALTIVMAVQSDEEAKRDIPVILAFADGLPCERLYMGQWKSNLIIRSRRTDSCRYDRSREIGVQDVLLKGTLRFIAISSSVRGTSVYVDGKLRSWRKGLSLLGPDEMLSGRLVLGNSADGKHPWTGTVSTLAAYDYSLSSEEVRQHYEAWRDSKTLSTRANSLPIMYYRFDERAGSIAKDHSGLGNDLIIPDRFTPLQRRMLVQPWNDFRANRSYALDIAINILGFVPFGFYISWYLRERGISRLRVIIIVMALGTGTTLFIELLQAYLPARSSQLTDVLTNTCGTAVGIYLWSRYVHSLHRSSAVDDKIRRNGTN